MEEQAKKLIHDHKNPMMRVDLPGTKLFLKSSTSEEAAFIEKYQNNLEKALRHSRVERRCARAQANWCMDTNFAKVTKVTKGLLHNFGHQDKSGIFFYPEETLVLMETNRLEVSFNGLPLSIQDGYELLLKTVSLNKYKVYKKLILHGYRLLRHQEYVKRKSKIKEKDASMKPSEVDNEKRTAEVIEASAAKRICIEPVEESSSAQKKEIQMELVNKTFKKIIEMAPRQFSGDFEVITPDYCVFSSANKSRLNYDFNLVVCEKDVLDKTKQNEVIPCLYAICSGDNISFFKCSEVHLPFL